MINIWDMIKLGKCDKITDKYDKLADKYIMK